MLRRSALVIAVVAAACIKLADFHPGGGSGTPDAHTADAAPAGECGNGAADQATASMSGTSVCASGPGYALRFPARGFHYPDQLRIGTHDVLGTSSACNEEDRAGITAYPLPRFSSDSTASGETATATILLAGPVVAKVAVSWSWHAAAACATGTFTGSSTFTLFPDGRLVRSDQLTTPAVAAYTPCDCGSAAQAFFVTAYMAFDPSLTIKNQSGSTVAPGTAYGTDLPALVCASGSDWAIGVAQAGHSRGRIVTGGAVALTEDFGTLGTSSLTAGTQSVVTAYQIGSAACTPSINAIAQYADATGPQLHVHSTNTFDDTIGTERDGMFGGDNGTASGLPTGAGTLTLTTSSAPIPPGWALWVSGTTLLPPTANPPRTGDWYKIQNGTNDGIIWFRDGLTGSDTITVPTP